MTKLYSFNFIITTLTRNNFPEEGNLYHVGFCFLEDYPPGLELQILKGTHFKAILKGQLRVPRPLHVKE